VFDIPGFIFYLELDMVLRFTKQGGEEDFLFGTILLFMIAMALWEDEGGDIDR
jgi:hypothetical protein